MSRSALRRVVRAAGRCLRLGLLLLIPTGIAMAAADEELRPVPEDSALSGQLGAVGMLIAGEAASSLSFATGFLISSCHVLTAGHVLARAGNKVRLGEPVKFQPPGQDGRVLLPPVWGRVIAADPDFTMSEKPPGFNLPAIARDWALVELDRPLTGIDPLKLAFPGAPIVANARFAIAGYPLGGRRITLHAQEHCRNWTGHRGATGLAGVVIADCAVRQGMSGGPLLVEGGGELLVAGIVVERVEIGRKIMAVAVATQVFAETALARMRDSEVCAAGSPFAWPPAPPTTDNR